MRQLEELDFPAQAAENIINTMTVTEDNIQEIKDLLFFANDLTAIELSDLVNELFNQVGV